MLTEHLPMSWWRIVSVALIPLVASCTEPNPRSCADGFCNDPAFPFCDADGALEGTPNTCIAVSCSPRGFIACRGESAIRCNDTGNDFEFVQCELGCEEAAGGCAKCSSNAQCANPTPVCDVSGGDCRGCQTDDECDSQVCDLATGACLAETQVVYASPTGSGTGSCLLGSPCTITRALQTSVADPTRATVRMLPGTYGAAMDIQGGTVNVVGTGATLLVTSGTRGLNVGTGANVSVRGLTLDLDRELRCDGANGRPKLTLSDLRIQARASGAIVTQCDLALRDVEIVFDAGGGDFTAVSGTSLDAERVLARGTDPTFPGSLLAQGTGLDIRVVNSVFDDASFGFIPQDTTSRLRFAFNTHHVPRNIPSAAMFCSGNAQTLIQNNVFHSPGATNSLDAATCTATFNVISPQMQAVAANNILQDPMLVNAANGNFHLLAGSPAIDAAMPSGGPDPAADFDGVARPQGAAKDIGAFEFKP